MKKVTFILIQFMFISCVFAQKITQENYVSAVNDFLNDELKESKVDSLHVFYNLEKKWDFIAELNKLSKTDKTRVNKSIHHLLSEKEIKNFEYQINNCLFILKQKDINSNNILIKSNLKEYEQKINLRIRLANNKDEKGQILKYYISIYKPLFSIKKDYFLIPYSYRNNWGIYIFKKEKEHWIYTTRILQKYSSYFGQNK